MIALRLFVVPTSKSPLSVQRVAQIFKLFFGNISETDKVNAFCVSETQWYQQRPRVSRISKKTDSGYTTFRLFSV